MSALPRVRITPDEYLDLERRGRVKSEYIDGDVYAMAEVYDKVPLEA